MKRVVQFKIDNEEYIFLEDEELIFSINSNDMQFDVKKFYEAFFEGEKPFDDIELVNLIEHNKNAERVYKLTNDLLKEIVAKLVELEKEDKESSYCEAKNH